MLEEEEDKDKEDEAEWSLGHGSQAQIQAIMQTHSRHWDMRMQHLDSRLLQGTEGVARVPMPTLATLLGL